MAEILGETYKDDIRRHLETLIQSYPDIRLADLPSRLTSDQESGVTGTWHSRLQQSECRRGTEGTAACQGGEKGGVAVKRTATDSCAHAREEGERGALASGPPFLVFSTISGGRSPIQTLSGKPSKASTAVRRLSVGH